MSRIDELRAWLAQEKAKARTFLRDEIGRHPAWGRDHPDWQRVQRREITEPQWVDLHWFGAMTTRNGDRVDSGMDAYSSWASGEHFNSVKPPLRMACEGTELEWAIEDRRWPVHYATPGNPARWQAAFGRIAPLAAEIERLELGGEPDEPEKPPVDPPEEPDPPPHPPGQDVTPVEQRVNELEHMFHEAATVAVDVLAKWWPR